MTDTLLSEGPLTDVRVIDLTSLIAGPYCTKLLADHGADVIKIEPPGTGDPARRLGPFAGDDPNIEKSGLFAYLNTNKRGITLNLESEGGRDCLRRLVATADLVVESFVPGVMAGLGLDYVALRALRPGIVLVSISNFGQTGPYRHFTGSELTLHAMGAEMHSVGIETREPLKQGGSSSLFQAGAMAAVGAMAGLSSARLQGIGQWVDVAIMETHLASADRRVPALLAYQFSGRLTERVAESGEGFPGGVYVCADGYVDLFGGVSYWSRVVEMLGNPPQLLDPKWTQPGAQADADLRDEFHETFYEWLFARSKSEVFEAAHAARVPCAPLFTMEDVLNDPGFAARGVWEEVDHPVMGRVRMPSRPMLWSKTPWSIRRAAPLLGQHTVEVLKAAGYSREEISMLGEAGCL